MLTPGSYAQMLSTRIEAQVAGDWMLVPSARNLHWRYEVLHSAFVTCKQRLSPDTDMKDNLDSLLKATKFIWERISKNQAKIKGAFVPINGRTEMLFQDDDLDSPGKLVLNSYLNTTKYISGWQNGSCFVLISQGYPELSWGTLGVTPEVLQGYPWVIPGALVR